MGKKITFIIVFICCATFNMFAQRDTIIQLEEVIVIANKRLQKNSKAYKLISIKDSVIVNNLESFTSLLRFNTPIYFRDNGLGGSSSASFRGTSASNTAVLWNGINVNSINNGQTDFNSFSVSLFDAIDVRSGGGSIEYGSGAIGGTVHLEDVLLFSETKKTENQLVTSVGSFSTLNTVYKLKQTNKKHTFNLGLSYNESENDFPIKNTEFKNSNGAYKNYAFSFSNSYKFSDIFKLNFYTTYSFSDRLFSGELPNPTSAKSKYEDINQRNLLSLNFKKDRLNLTTKFAYLFQKYKYYQNKLFPEFNFGSSDRYFIDFIVDYDFFFNAILTSRTKYESVFGKTDQTKNHNRKELTQSFIFKHSPSHIFTYDVKIRKDFNSDFKVPTSYAVGFRVKPFNKIFFRANTSKNYRVPTYNDLYWPIQGNENLIPESSLQGEFGLGYASKKIFFDIAYFTIYSDNKIVWTPNGDPTKPGVWVPINLEKTKNSGIEISSKYKSELFNKIKLNLFLNYAYTLAKNQRTNKFLPFIPKHLFNANLNLAFNKVNVFFQQLHNGETFTTTSNSKDFVTKSFQVSNVGANYLLISKPKQSLLLGFKINNIFDNDYQVVNNRPMPGINYNFNINYKF
mgnify:CR=1 FL=1